MVYKVYIDVRYLTAAKEVYVLNSSDILRGLTDTLILSQLYSADSYGYEINKTLQKKSDGEFEFKEATLYTSFRRLEDSGCILSYWGDENSGARRRYYAITDSGKKLLEENKREWETISAMVKKLIA